MSRAIYNTNSRAHSPSFPSLHLRHSSFSNPSLALPTSQLILQPVRCFTYVTAHSPILLSLLLRHRIFTYVTWRAAHVTKLGETGHHTHIHAWLAFKSVTLCTLFFLCRISHCGLRLFQLLPSFLFPFSPYISLILSLCFSLLSSVQAAPVFLLGLSWKFIVIIIFFFLM